MELVLEEEIPLVDPEIFQEDVEDVEPLFIVEELRRPRKWYFKDGEYLAMEGDTICAKIHGDQLVNPDLLRLRLLEIQQKLNPNDRALFRTEPDPVTIALYNHWRNNA